MTGATPLSSATEARCPSARRGVVCSGLRPLEDYRHLNR